MKKIILVLLLMVFLLSACAPADSTDFNNVVELPSLFSGVHRFVDTEYNVVCYVYAGGSISCVSY